MLGQDAVYLLTKYIGELYMKDFIIAISAFLLGCISLSDKFKINITSVTQEEY